MEARITGLESAVSHLRTDVADIKVDVRALRDKMDAITERFDGKFDAVKKSIDGTRFRLDLAEPVPNDAVHDRRDDEQNLTGHSEKRQCDTPS